MNRKILLAAVGNPNVDKSVELRDESIFKKFNLLMDIHIPVSIELLKSVEDEIKARGLEIQFSPGGCCQNTLKVFQWLINFKFDSVMIGGVGDDKEASYLEKELKNYGIVTCYTKLSNNKTSSVLILIYKNSRTPIYNLSTGAARLYSLNHLHEDHIALNSIKNSKIVLLEGFFTVQRPEVGLEVMKICSNHAIITSFNIAGEYVATKIHEVCCVPFVKLCNIVIGNKTEFENLCHLMNIPTDNFHDSLLQMYNVMLLQKLSSKYDFEIFQKYPKLLLITNGPFPLYCIVEPNNVIEYKPQIIAEEQIKSTTGAGDSFLAGFLYGILHNLPILKCLDIGCNIAAEIIQLPPGCLPNKNPLDIYN